MRVGECVDCIDDENRVKLSQLNNDPLSSYINASFIRVSMRHDMSCASYPQHSTSLTARRTCHGVCMCDRDDRDHYHQSFVTRLRLSALQTVFDIKYDKVWERYNYRIIHLLTVIYMTPPVTGHSSTIVP